MEPTIPARTRTSVLLNRVDRVITHAAVAGVVAGIVVAFLIAVAIAGFPESWQFLFATFASAVTVVMVFVLHHTQRREQVATQLKLDELIRALPQADDHFVRVQAAADDEVNELEQRLVEHHRATRAE